MFAQSSRWINRALTGSGSLLTWLRTHTLNISGPSICCLLNLAFFTASSRLYANLDFEGIIGWETEGQVITHPALSHGGETK
jgi:hypothetical protein